MTDTYDLIAIGSGPAGESATELASFFGHRCAVIEKARPGGTVTTTGGAPTKTLREAALYFSGLVEGDVYGIRISAPPEVATDTIRKRTRDVCDLLQKVTADNIAKNNVDYIQGAARLDRGRQRDCHRRLTDGARGLRAKVVLIATGSRPWRPPNIPFDLKGVCDTDTILQRGRVPKDMLIVGGGPVGVEFATIAHALGAKVTLADRGNRLMAMMDGEITECMEEAVPGVGHPYPVRIDLRQHRREERCSGDQDVHGRNALSRHGLVRGGTRGEHRGFGPWMPQESPWTPVGGSSWTSTFAPLWKACTRQAMFLDRLSPRSPWSMAAWRFAMPSAFPSRESWIRLRCRRSTACRKFRARVSRKSSAARRALTTRLDGRTLPSLPRGAIAGRGGRLKLIFLKERSQAGRRALHWRHRLGNRRDRSDGHPMRRNDEHHREYVAQHPDL